MVKGAFRTSLYILRFEWFDNKLTETFSLFGNSNRTLSDIETTVRGSVTFCLRFGKSWGRNVIAFCRVWCRFVSLQPRYRWQHVEANSSGGSAPLSTTCHSAAIKSMEISTSRFTQHTLWFFEESVSAAWVRQRRKTFEYDNSRFELGSSGVHCANEHLRSWQF